MSRLVCCLLLLLLLASASVACAGAAREHVRIEPVATPAPVRTESPPVSGVATAPAIRFGTPPALAATPATARPAAPTVGSGPRPPERDDPALRLAVEQALGPGATSAGVVVRRLTDGRGTAINPEKVFYAASLYKLEVLYEAFRQREAGLLSFAGELTVNGRYLDEDLGTFLRVPRTAGGGVSVASAVAAMVTLSDNTSATMLLDLLGHRSIDRTMVALGLRDSSVNTEALPVSARDMALLMEMIVRGAGVGPRAAREMVQLLLEQETRAGIPQALPAGIAVGNKTGTWPGSTHDVAIVFAPSGPYVLAVLTEGDWDWDTVARVSAVVYAELERQPAMAGR